MDTPPDMKETVVVGKQGRIVIPAKMREALAIREGHRVTLEVKDGELHLITVQAAFEKVRRILGITGPPPPGAPSIVDEFLAEKRIEAVRESELIDERLRRLREP